MRPRAPLWTGLVETAIGMVSTALAWYDLFQPVHVAPPFAARFIRWGQPLLKGWLPEQSYGVYWLWVLVVIIPFCFLFFKWVEKPGMKLGERFYRRKANTAIPAAGLSTSGSKKSATGVTYREVPKLIKRET
jgi:hypothetical protein